MAGRLGFLVLLLLSAFGAFVVRLDVPKRPSFEPIPSPRKAKVLRDALAAFSLADGSEWITLVTRVGLIRGTPGTLLTLYGPDGMVKQSATLDRPWSLMLHEKDRVRGVLLRNDVELDSVALNDSD